MLKWRELPDLSRHSDTFEPARVLVLASAPSSHSVVVMSAGVHSGAVTPAAVPVIVSVAEDAPILPPPSVPAAVPVIASVCAEEPVTRTVPVVVPVIARV